MKTAALLVDAYRELNSKKLFWITMLLSGLVVAIVATLGINTEGITFLWFTIIPNEIVTANSIPPSEFYVGLFTNFGVRFWLSIIATILALIGTAGIIPDLISGGSIELLLSKPISRTRLYLTKFTTGLLFVSLQVLVFAVAAILVIGIRGELWEPRILLAVPIVALFYSYLFSICALIGLLTRSTLAALLLTVLFWFVLFLLNVADNNLLGAKVASELSAEQARTRLVESGEYLQSLQDRYATMVGREGSDESEESTTSPESSERTGYLNSIKNRFSQDVPIENLSRPEVVSRIERVRNEMPQLEDRVSEQESAYELWSTWHSRVLTVKTVLPKTSDTTRLLERYLISDKAVRDSASRTGQMVEDEQVGNQELAVREGLRSRPLWWIIGTSLAFEAFILAIGAWIFSRRDF